MPDVLHLNGHREDADRPEFFQTGGEDPRSCRGSPGDGEDLGTQSPDDAFASPEVTETVERRTGLTPVSQERA